MGLLLRQCVEHEENPETQVAQEDQMDQVDRPDHHLEDLDMLLAHDQQQQHVVDWILVFWRNQVYSMATCINGGCGADDSKVGLLQWMSVMRFRSWRQHVPQDP